MTAYVILDIDVHNLEGYEDKAWINSEEYREARALRHQYATSQAVVVDGV
jgi:uncharacterized protein (DUF1330 family)